MADRHRTGIASSGFDDVSLVSLSTADHSQADEMAHKVTAAMKPEQVSISLPSLRADSFSVGLAEAAGEVKKNGFTFAPETGIRAAPRRDQQEHHRRELARRGRAPPIGAAGAWSSSTS